MRESSTRIALTARAALAVGLSAVAAGCNLMDKIPKGGPPPQPPPPVQVVTFPSTDGVTLEGWFLPGAALLAKPGTRQPAVLFCHGVQDSADSNMADFIKRAGYTVFSFDYRGFGNSTQADLSARALADDSWAAFEYLRSHPDVDPEKIAVYGHSLGGAMALSVGARAFHEHAPLACVVSASAFSTYRRAINDFFPVGGFILGGSNAPDPEDWAAQMGNIPLLITHAADDTILPPYHADRIARAAISAGVPVEIVIAARGDHVAAYVLDQELPLAVLDFLSRNIGPARPSGPAISHPASTTPAQTAP